MSPSRIAGPVPPCSLGCANEITARKQAYRTFTGIEDSIINNGTIPNFQRFYNADRMRTFRNFSIV